jgi:hypothetical protein
MCRLCWNGWGNRMNWNALFSSQWHLQWQPLLHEGWALALLLMAALMGGLALWQRKRRLVWRALAFILLAVAVMNPLLSLQERTPLPSVVWVVDDQSASQTVTGRAEATSLAANRLADKLAAMDHVTVQRLTLTSRGREGTELFALLDQQTGQTASDQIGGVVVVSDGQVHDLPLGERSGWGRQWPLHLIQTGKPDDYDRRLVLDKAPRFMLLNEPYEARLNVIDEGQTPQGAPVQLTVRRNGEDFVSLTVRAGEPFSLPLSVDHAGNNLFEVQAQTLEGEVSTVNNRLVIAVEGIRETLRVLLVSGEPHTGERVWRNLLKSDTSVDMVHFTILRPPHKQDSTPINELSLIAFPTRELFAEKINDFDLIVLDRYQRRGVLPRLYFSNIVDFVKQGGGLLIASGPEYADRQSLWQSPLSDVLPAEPSGQVSLQRYVPELSETGLRHPVTAGLRPVDDTSGEPSWGPWYSLVQAAQVSGQTLLTGQEDRPLLVLNRVEDGRVAMLMSDHIWLWARDHQGGGPHQAMLRNIAHWLMQEPELEEERLIARNEGQDLVVQRRTLKDEVEPLSILSPEGQQTSQTMQEVRPGLYEARISAEEKGLWSFEQGELTTLAHIGQVNTLEMQKLLASADPLQSLLDQPKGSVKPLSGLDLDKMQTLMVSSSGPFSGRNWIGFQRSTASTLDAVRQQSLLTGLLGLALLAGLFSLVWWREGR